MLWIAANLQMESKGTFFFDSCLCLITIALYVPNYFPSKGNHKSSESKTPVVRNIFVPAWKILQRCKGDNLYICPDPFEINQIFTLFSVKCSKWPMVLVANCISWIFQMYFSDSVLMIPYGWRNNHATSHITAHCLGGSRLIKNVTNNFVDKNTSRNMNTCMDQIGNENTNILILAVHSQRGKISAKHSKKSWVPNTNLYHISFCSYLCVFAFAFKVVRNFVSGYSWGVGVCLVNVWALESVNNHTSIQLTPWNHCKLVVSTSGWYYPYHWY